MGHPGAHLIGKKRAPGTGRQQPVGVDIWRLSARAAIDERNTRGGACDLATCVALDEVQRQIVRGTDAASGEQRAASA